VFMRSSFVKAGPLIHIRLDGRATMTSTFVNNPATTASPTFAEDYIAAPERYLEWGVRAHRARATRGQDAAAVARNLGLEPCGKS